MTGLNPSVLINYPVVLTDKDWQKKKGLMAKKVKTGLKAELDAGEALHKKIDTGFLMPARNSPKSMEELEQGVKAAKEYFASHVKPLMEHMKAIVKAANEASTLMTKNKYKDAAKAADAIAKAADLFGVTCKSITWEDDYEAARKRIQMRIDLAVKELKPSIAKFRTGAEKYLNSDQTNVAWNADVKQNGRSVSNSIAVLDGYKTEFWPKFQLFDGFDLDTMKLSADDEETKKKRKKIITAALKIVDDIAEYKPN